MGLSLAKLNISSGKKFAKMDAYVFILKNRAGSSYSSLLKKPVSLPLLYSCSPMLK